MRGSGTTRIDAIFVNLAASQVCGEVHYEYEGTSAFDHVPLSIRCNIDAFKDTIRVAVSPAALNIRTLCDLPHAGRKQLLEREALIFDEV